jgi:hypothetical protein
MTPPPTIVLNVARPVAAMAWFKRASFAMTATMMIPTPV